VFSLLPLMNKKITVGTHDGKFHPDEIFALAILKRVYSSLRYIRTRDEETLAKVDIRIDVGGKYDPETQDYDHHQPDFSLKRENDIPYSSCGLIWKHFGEKVVLSKRAWESIEGKLIQFIDAGDNGIDYALGNVSIYSVAEVIDSFNRRWNDPEDEDVLFARALDFATVILDNEIKKANAIEEGENIVSDVLKQAKGEYVIFPQAGLPKGKLLSKTDFKFYIFPIKKDSWASVAMKVKEGSFECKIYFPKDWAGLLDAALEDACGVKGATFCHKNLFMIVAKTKEAVIAMTEKALEKANAPQ